MSASGDRILGSMREARAILRGERDGELVVHVPPDLDVLPTALRPMRDGRAYVRCAGESCCWSCTTGSARSTCVKPLAPKATLPPWGTFSAICHR